MSLPFDSAHPTPAAAGDPVSRVGRPWLDADAIFAFICVTGLILAPFAPASGAGVAGAALAGLGLRGARLGRTLRRRWFVFLVPLAALAAVTWSTAPRPALLQAAELAVIALAGVLIASARRPAAVLTAIAAACLAGLAPRLALGGGIAGAQGLLEVAGLGLLAALAALAAALRQRRGLWGAAMLAAAASQALALLAVASSEALLRAALALIPLAMLTPLVGAPMRVRAAATALAAIAALAVSILLGDAPRALAALVMAGGWTSAAAVAAATVVGAGLLVHRFLRRPDALGAFWIAALLFALERLTIGGLGLAPMTLPTLLLFASLGAGLIPATRLAAERRRPLPAAQVISLAEARALRRPASGQPRLGA